MNVLARPCDAMFADGIVRYSHWAVPDVEFERSEFYTDFFQPLDLHYSFGIKAPLATGGLAYLSMQRPKRARPFEDEQGDVLRVLLPHLQRALALQNQAKVQAFASQGAEAGLSAFGKIALGVDARGYLRYASAAAQSLLQIGDALYEAQGRLRARDVASDQALRTSLQSVLNLEESFLQGRQATAWIRRRDDARALRVVVVPLARASADGLDMAAVVLASDRQARNGSRAASMAGLYGLTPTECRVADLLLNGCETREIAQQLRTSVETTRFHLKRILAKTGQPRQAELVRMMLDLPATTEHLA